MSEQPAAKLGDTSAQGQRARLLAWLSERPIDTFTARHELNVAHPAARIQELREQGYNIRTHRRPVLDEHGRKHSAVAMYYLSAANGDNSRTEPVQEAPNAAA